MNDLISFHVNILLEFNRKTFYILFYLDVWNHFFFCWFLKQRARYLKSISMSLVKCPYRLNTKCVITKHKLTLFGQYIPYICIFFFIIYTCISTLLYTRIFVLFDVVFLIYSHCNMTVIDFSSVSTNERKTSE